MDSEENTQEVVNDNRAQAGTTADASNKILSMWNSEEQTASEVTDAPVDETEVEETEEAEEVERDRLYITIKALDLVEQHIKSVFETGKLAEKEQGNFN